MYLYDQKTSRKTSLYPVSQRVKLNLTCSDNVRILCLSSNVKTPMQLPNCLNGAKNVFLMVSSEKFVLLLFLAIALHESGTRTAIYWSVAVYKQQVSSPCNLISQTEQVHDK